ncbi:hypothetical protein WJX75_006588 [Coccomyxa subellipsoidea]|uniref:Thioredoxin domain-containing protein n=1 Tax=Coccomyxa subellipsoidea TaxID=248742 RepID=A0ABR2YI13_9CHLO
MRSFLNDISSRPAYAHVVFAELDVDNDSIKGIAEAEDLAALPTVQFWKGEKCVDVAKGGTPMVVMQKIQNHAGARPEASNDRQPAWQTVAKFLGAGVGVAAAGGGEMKRHEQFESCKRFLSGSRKCERLQQGAGEGADEGRLALNLLLRKSKQTCSAGSRP